MNRVRYSKQELVDYVLDFKLKHNRFPERRDFLHNLNYPSSSQYVREWGSWGNALMEITGRKTAKEKLKFNEFKCIHCGKVFNAYNVRRKFCSVECRDAFNLLGNIPRNYRLTAFKSYPWLCEVCGYSEYTNYLSGKSKSNIPTLYDVHHIDGNRRNNNYENLCILCPTCHAKIERGIIRNLGRKHKLFLKLTWNELSEDEFLDISSSVCKNYDNIKKMKKKNEAEINALKG